MLITLLDNDYLQIKADLGANFGTLSKFPGKTRWKERLLLVQPSGINLTYILDKFPDADWDAGATEVRDNYIKLKIEEQNAREDKKEELVDQSGYEFRTIPRPHQRKSFILARDRESWGHFHAPRTGKTKIIIDTAAYLFERGKIDRVIVVAPNGVHINWIIEGIADHLPQRIPFEAHWYSTQKGKREYAAMFAAGTSNDFPVKLKFLAMNVEGFSSDKAVELIENWLDNGDTLFVIDESTRISNHSAKRTKLLVKLGERAKYRRILTGTPINKGVENLYPQFKFLDDRILGHTTFTTFKAQYCVMGGFEGRVITDYKNIQELSAIIDGHSDRVTADQVPDMPRKDYKRSPFELLPEQRRLYEAFRKSSLEEIQAMLGNEEGLKRAQELAITKTIRMHQIACGLTPSEAPEFLDYGRDPRMATLMNEIEEARDAGHKVIIYARFKQNLRAIYKALGDKRAVPYWGEIPQQQRLDGRLRFQSDDSIWYIVAHVQSAGIGIPLHAADTTIYHSNISNLELRLQSEDRCVSADPEKDRKLIVDLEAIKTVDRKIINCLRKRKELSDEILDDPRVPFLEE